MTDRNFVLRWAHLGLGRNPRHREIIEEQRRSFEANVADIQAEQEQKSAELAARKASSSRNMRLAVAPRYAKGIAHRRRSRGVGRDSITSARDEAE
jgi:hypothetical protein